MRRRRPCDAHAVPRGCPEQARLQLFRLSHADDGDECRSIRHSQPLAAAAEPAGHHRSWRAGSDAQRLQQLPHSTGEDPEWAAQTIAFAKELAPPVAGGFFGPGRHRLRRRRRRRWRQSVRRQSCLTRWKSGSGFAGHSSPWPASSASWSSRGRSTNFGQEGNHMLNWLSRFGAWIDRTARRSWAGIARFFWPDPQSSIWRRLLPYVTIAWRAGRVVPHRRRRLGTDQQQ